MIFSFLKSGVEKNLDLTLEATDYFCFFAVNNSVSINLENWPTSVAASLRLKKNVLILESELIQLPVLSSRQRIVCGDQFLWLAPHALSVFNQAVIEKTGSYAGIKTFLSNFKS